MSTGDPQTRRRILRATRQLVEQREGRGVRMSDIAQEADVSRQALYLHFGSRTELLLATVQYVDDQEGFRERTLEICSAAQSEESLDAFIAFWATYVPKIYGMAKALLAARHDDPAAAAAWEKRMSGLRGICALLASRLKDESRLAEGWSLETAADFIWAMISIPMWANLRLERGWSERRYVEAVRTAIHGTVLRRPEEGAVRADPQAAGSTVDHEGGGASGITESR